MTEPTPKKRKSTRKKSGDGDESADETALKERVLTAALPDAAFDGFSDSVLAKAGKKAGLDKDEVVRLFPDGGVSLIEFYSLWADGEMEKLVGAMDLAKMKIRERIAAAVLARLSVIKPHKEAARRAAAALSLPMHAARAAKLLYHSVDTMWRAVGDTSTDFNFYTKRGILAGVYGATLLRWFNDQSEDEKPTRDFLAARIENVMQFERFKGEARKFFANLAQFGEKARTKK
ncbi:MAG TPA: COQ9 family protein [Rhizomicrobium sp.]|nr:COQ9 family protein [Rhizomicrobium sp.]